GVLIHTCCVIARMSGDLDPDRSIQADRKIVGAVGILDPDLLDALQSAVQELIELAHSLSLQVEADRRVLAHALAVHCTDHEYTSAGFGSNTVACLTPGRWASERNSVAIATYSPVSATTAGLQANGSRTSANLSRVPMRNVKKPSKSANACCSAVSRDSPRPSRQ